MKKRIQIFKTILIITVFSCNRIDDSVFKKDPNDNSVLKERTGSFYHDYLYDGTTYRLWFNDGDTTGIPTNTSTADSLEYAIGNNELTLIHDDNYENLTIIQNIMDDYGNECDTSFQLSPTGNAVIATFYQDINYGGSSFTFDALNTGSWYTRIINGVTCRAEWNIPSLSSLWINYPTTSWNNQISSFKMHQSGEPLRHGWMQEVSLVRELLFNLQCFERLGILKFQAVHIWRYGICIQNMEPKMQIGQFQT